MSSLVVGGNTVQMHGPTGRLKMDERQAIRQKRYKYDWGCLQMDQINARSAFDSIDLRIQVGFERKKYDGSICGRNQRFQSKIKKQEQTPKVYLA